MFVNFLPKRLLHAPHVELQKKLENLIVRLKLKTYTHMFFYRLRSRRLLSSVRICDTSIGNETP